jgi:hypothetical protein
MSKCERHAFFSSAGCRFSGRRGAAASGSQLDDFTRSRAFTRTCCGRVHVLAVLALAQGQRDGGDHGHQQDHGSDLQRVQVLV